MLFSGTESEYGVCVCEEGGPRKWKWSLCDLLAARREDCHLSPSWSLLGGGESVHPQSSWALAVPTERCLVIFDFPACSAGICCWSPYPWAFGSWYKSYFVEFSSWHQESAGPLIILAPLHLPWAFGGTWSPGHQVWEHPCAYVSGHCPFLLSAPVYSGWGIFSQTCSLPWLCLGELAPSLIYPGSLTPHPLFCPPTWGLLPTSPSIWWGLPQVIFYSFPEVAFTLPPSLGP